MTGGGTEGDPKALRYLLLVNPSAGGGRARRSLPRVEAEMRRLGLRYRCHRSDGLGDAIGAAREAADAGEIPVVMSGDGLVGAVGGALADGPVPLGLIPGGRGNDLARVLGIPTDPAAAVAVLAAGRRRRIDVGEANGQRFLCIASCGFDSEANRIANEARLIRGPLVYAYAALRALWSWRAARFTVTLDGRERSLSGYSVAAANSGAYGGGMMLAPGALLDDGLLDVVATGATSKARFLLSLPSVFKGTHVERAPVTVERARVVEISADRPFDVYADGERLTTLPVRISLLPRALELIAPTR